MDLRKGCTWQVFSASCTQRVHTCVQLCAVQCASMIAACTPPLQIREHGMCVAVCCVCSACMHAPHLGEREEDTTSAGSHGGNCGGQQSLGEHEGVGKAQRGLAEGRHDRICDAVAQTRLDEATSQPVGDGDEPAANTQSEKARWVLYVRLLASTPPTKGCQQAR